MKKIDVILGGESGFTLIELLIAILVSGILAACIFTVYMSQERAAEQVENMSAMQQNLRSALLLMERDIRMAGCDPTLNAIDAFSLNAPNGIVTADAASFRFISDLRGTTAADESDGQIDNAIEPNEDITYALVNGNLERNGEIIAENVLALDFVYLDEDGNVLNPSGTNLATGNFDNIRTVQLSILVQAPLSERDYVNNQSYVNLQGRQLLAPQGDRFRKLLAVSSIRIRNL